ncbi:plasmid replication initiator RepA [Candidatus Hoaglandella endobia]|uniref:Replication initiation protein n=1 Tax=Candidatus Hoaglandella endobia TaxID=1778263 RepID=A0A143WRI5_9ENTR|nr:plasmid replication initiator RepA [Candidatus Hoaglandella endobia]CUX96374.1 Replication initiation protein [Candidatus Hoaglandella endobia]
MDKKTSISSAQIVAPAFLSRSYVNNPHPCYQPPKADMKPPRIIDAMRKSARENPPSKHPLWRTAPRFHAITHGLLWTERAMNLHRRRAVDAIMECLAAHVNLVTSKVFMTLGQISDACGLTTYNRHGQPCYSRASRAINEHIEAIGAVHCERVWDETSGSYIPNIIWVTELFFVLIGYEYGKYLAAQQQQLAWENHKRRETGEGPISLTEARRRAKTQHIKRAFEMRTQKQAHRKQVRRALKLAALDKQEAQNAILKDLVKLYSKDELVAMEHVQLKRLVEQRYHVMRKLATAPPPS